MKKLHVLLDFENVQPSMDELALLVPGFTDVWLFHGPKERKRSEQLRLGDGRVTLVPHPGKGKNALDFHLSFYLGYVAAKNPDAQLVVVANDKGYDPMIAHASATLGFAVRRLGFKALKPANKVAAKKVTAKQAVKATHPAAPPTTPAPAAQAPAKPTPAKKAPAKKVPSKTPAKKASAKKVAAKKATAKKAAAAKAPAAKASRTKKVAAQNAPAASKAPAAKAVQTPADKVLARAKASFAKMGKNRPTKFASLLRHLKSIVGQAATEADADALSRRLEDTKVIQVVGDMVLYP